MECPNCKSENLRRSQHRGILEWLQTRLLVRRYMRCRDCEHRFTVKRSSDVQEKTKPVS